jgi:hypothetical protein
MSADGSHVRQITRLTEAELLSLSWKPDPVPGSTGEHAARSATTGGAASAGR